MGKARSVQSDTTDVQIDDVFLNLAEQLKMPFVAIAYAAELLQGSHDNIAETEQLRRTIALSSQNALKLIDGYLLSVSLQRQGRLEFEPVSMSSVLYDSAQDLHAFAQAMGCELRLQVHGKYEPVMAHRQAVRSALTALGYVFIEAATNHESEEAPVVSLVVRRNPGGISTGVYSNNSNLTATLLNQARKLQGRVHQPLGGLDSGNASGVFIADTLFAQLQTTLKVARSRGLYGLAATLPPSRQLNLV